MNNQKLVLPAILTVMMAVILWSGQAMTAENMDSDFKKIVAAEKASNWTETSKLIAEFEKQHKLAADDKYAKHLQKAKSAISNIEQAKGQEKAGELGKAGESATKAVDIVNAQYEQQTDQELLNAVKSVQANYKDQIATQELNEQKYNLALKFEKAGKYKDGLTLLDELTKDKQVDTNTRKKYQLLWTKLKQEEVVSANPEFWQEIWNKLYSDLKTALPAILWVLVIYLGYWGYRKIFRPYYDDFMEIGLEDQTNPSGNKDDLNAALSQEFDQALKQIVNQINKGGELDGLIELGGGHLASQSVGKGEAENITKYLDSNTIQFGVFKFTPKSLFDMLSYMTRTRGKFSVSGVLVKESGGQAGEDEYILHVEKTPISERANNTSQIYVGRAKTRAEAIKQTAMQMVVKESVSTVTREWRSLDALTNGKEVLDNLVDASLSMKDINQPLSENEKAVKALNEKIKSQLGTAKSLLEKSLAIDPSNWVARYRLANLMQRTGDSDQAYWQYNYVLDLLLAEEEKRNDNLYSYALKEPMFPFTLLYRKIIAMSKKGLNQLKSSRKEQRLNGFATSLKSIYGLGLLTSGIADSCKDKAIKAELIDLHEKIQNFFKAYNDHGVSLMLPDNKELEKADENALTRSQIDSIANTIIIKSESDSNLDKKAVVYDLIYQIYAGVISILAAVYEYNMESTDIHAGGVINDLMRQVEDIETWFYQKRGYVKDTNRNSYAFSHAISHNALGRAYYIQFKNGLTNNNLSDEDASELAGVFSKAERFLKWAIGYHLPASFPEPYINLAILYLKADEKEKFQLLLPHDWNSQARQYLQKALQLNPNSAQAHYLLGRLYQLNIDDDIALKELNKDTVFKSNKDKALEEFESAGENSFSYFRAGQIYANENNYELALYKLKHCLRIYRRYDEPHQLYFDVMLKYLQSRKDNMAQDDKGIAIFQQEVATASTDLDALRCTCLDKGNLIKNDQCSGNLDPARILEISNGLQILADETSKMPDKISQVTQ